METNELMKRVLREAIQEELEGFFQEVQELSEGDLEQLEKQVVKTSQKIGRRLLEGILNSRLRKPRPVARRQGSCGYRQRLVGERPKELLTLVGTVTSCARMTNAWGCRKGCVAKIFKLSKKEVILQLNKGKTGKRCTRFLSKKLLLQPLHGRFC